MKSKKIFILLSALALSLAACNSGTSTQKSSVQGGSENTPSTPASDPSSTGTPSEPGSQTVAVTAVTLDKTELALEVNQSATLVATVTPSNASSTKVTWESSDTSVATVSSLGKVTAVKVGTAKITAKSQSNPEVKAECTVTVTEEGGKYGSLNKPKTVAEILAIAAEECKNDQDHTADQVYVKGLISKAPTNKGTYSQNIYLKDSASSDKELLVYSANHSAEKTPYQNDEVILHGYLMNYRTTIEISNVTINGNKVYPEIDSITRGTSTISYSAEHGSFNADAPKSGKNLSEFTFSVTPAQGYKIDNVMVNGEEVAAQADGSYKATVKGNTAVVANISEEGVSMLSATMKYSGETTNMAEGNNASLVNLDPSVFEVTSDNPTGIYAGLNAAGNIRLYNGYKNTADRTLGTKITVSSRRVTVKKITITLNAGSPTGFADLEVKAGDKVVTGTDGVYEIEDGTFSLKNVSNAEASKQIHIDQVVIAYVEKALVPATAIALDKNTLELEAGKSAVLVATLTPSDSTDVIVWSSDNEAIAKVDQTGKVEAVAEGMTVIVAKVSDTLMARCQVTVKAAKVINYGSATAPLTIAEAKAVLEETGTNNSAQPLFVKGIVSTNKAFNTTYDNGEIWLQSDDGTVEKAFELYNCGIDASIDNAAKYKVADGLKGCEVVATGYGKIYRDTYELTNVTIDGNKINPSIISLVPPAAVDATAVKLNKTSAELEINDELQLTATLEPAGAVGEITWSSSAAAVATVDQTGKVVAVAAGEATITAKVSDAVKAECAITVKAQAAAPKALPADGLKINVETLDLNTNKSYANNNNRAVTVSEIDLVLDPDSVGTIMKASAPYVATGSAQVDCMQFKKGNLVGFKTKDKIEAAKVATVKLFASGYSTEGADYLPYFLIGSSTTPIKANEIDATTNKASGVANGQQHTDGKDMYVYELSYDLSAVNGEAITFVTAKSGAAYISEIVISNASAPVVSNEAMPWYTEGTGNQAIHFEGAGIWTWVKYDSMGYADFNEFNAAKDNFVAAYESEPAASIVDKVISDDNATLKYARVYIVLSAAYNTGRLTLTIPGKDGKTYEGTLEFSSGDLVKINGVDFAAPVAQPTGAFRGLAKTAAGTFIPVDMILAADSAALSVNGEAANVTSYSWDNKDTLTIVTDGAYGTITAKFANNVFTITNLTGQAAAQLDLTFAVQLSGNCQFIDCGAMTLDQMNAMFVRRYDRNDGNGWQINNPSDGRISAVTKEGRAGLQCNGFSSGKVGFTLKADLAQPIPGTAIKSLGCWIYNPGETSFQMKLFAYKSANRATNGQLNTFTIEPGWHFYQTGVVNGSSFTSSDSFYNFQFYYENTSINPVFDDLCIYM